MGAVFAIFSGLHFWFGLMTGLAYYEGRGQLLFIALFIGVNVTFFPMHMLGLAGFPRRMYDYADVFAGWNSIASIGSLISFFALLSLAGSVYSIGHGNAGVAPHKATTLEWVLPIAPANHTFAAQPVLHHNLVNGKRV